MSDINRTSIALPAAVSNEIMAKTVEGSTIMQLARQVALPGRGLSIPVIVSDPVAEWVGETANKPVSNAVLSTKVLRPYKIAVIETVSKEFARDAAALYEELVRRLPSALAKVFDATVIGKTTVPGTDFDALGSVAGVNLNDATLKAYGALVSADTAIGTAGYTANGIAVAPAGKGILLSATDTTGRPIFNPVSDDGLGTILGQKVVVGSGVDDSANDVVGIMGDWTKAVYGTVNNVEVSFSEDATLTVGSGASAQTLSMFQQNMIAVRAEIEVGFRADTAAFKLLKKA